MRASKLCADPPSEVAVLARGHVASGRALELDRSLLDPAHCDLEKAQDPGRRDVF
jgi:hypothetical protein